MKIDIPFNNPQVSVNFSECYVGGKLSIYFHSENRGDYKSEILTYGNGNLCFIIYQWNNEDDRYNWMGENYIITLTAETDKEKQLIDNGVISKFTDKETYFYLLMPFNYVFNHDYEKNHKDNWKP